MPLFVHRLKSVSSLLKNMIFSAKSMQLFLVLITVLSTSSGAFGKIRTFADDALSVNTRYNPAYDPAGIRVGDFNLSPSISNALKYNDNVYASSIDKVHDLIFTVRPEIRLDSDFVRHELNASFYLEEGYYKDNDGENYTDYGLNLNTRLDIGGQTSAPITVSYLREHVRRGSPDERASLESTAYNIFESTMGLVHQGQNIALKAVAGFKRYVFENTIGTVGTLDNGDRDRNLYSLYTSMGMAPEAIFAPYIYSNLVQINYDRDLDRNGFDRDAFEYEAGIGTIINFSDVTRATFTIGHINRNMSDSSLEDISGLSYSVNLMWEPSTLASFLLEGKRSIEESTLDDISASVNSSLRLSMNYELYPNLFLRPSAGFVENLYEGSLNAKTHTWDAGLSATYKMNRNIWLTANYQYINQDEKDPSPELESYENNLFGVSMKLQF